MIVRDMMLRQVASVTEDYNISQVVELMSENGYSCMLVCRSGEPVGIVTERDIIHVFHRSLALGGFEDDKISEAMTANPECVEESTSLNEALRIVKRLNVRHLPVVSNNKQLTGVVSAEAIAEACVELKERESELVEVNKELRMMSLEDPLLGIGNRRAMDIDLAYTHASAIRYKRDFAVSLFDVDFFKKYNDHYGHQAGDKALKVVVKALRENIREADRLYRYGGEEILLLMPETGYKEALLIADRCRGAVENLAFEHELSTFERLTVSAGVAAGIRHTWKAVVENADRSLYKAKDAGRNVIC